MDGLGFLLFLVVSLRMYECTWYRCRRRGTIGETLLKKKLHWYIQDRNPNPCGQFHHGCKLSNPLETPWSVIVYNFQKVLLSAKTI